MKGYATMDISRGARRQAGLSLIELMVALVLGLLVSIGIVTLFGATGKTNRVQYALARLQENGRYAISRISEDLRMSSGQFCSNSSTSAMQLNYTDNGQQAGPRVMTMRVKDFRFPDGGNNTLIGDVSPRYLMQGYDCTASTCTPAFPAAVAPQTTTLPAMGTTAGKRVQGADVLTVRYQRGMGWPVTACTGDTKATFTVKPYAGDASITPKAPADPDLSFSKNDIALITDCNTSEIYQVGNAVSSGAANSYPSVNLTPLESGPPNTATCFGNYSGQDVRAFNFSTDFVTVTYFLQLKANPSADAPAGSLIPVLVRRTAAGKSSGTAGSTGVPVDTELVEGVERLDFLYGVEDDSGSVSYLTAKDVDAITVCPSKATSEAKCGWRSVKSIEVHLLVDTVDSTFGLTSADTAYRYGGNSVTSATMNDGPAPSSTMPVTGLKAGSMMRREFVSLISLRNNSP